MDDKKKKKKKKTGRVVALDGDKLGHIVGAGVALVVMALCFFYQKVDGFATALRVGWAFVIAYGTTFFFIRILLRVALFEFVIQKQEKGKTRGGKEEGEEGESETPAPGEPGASPP